VSHPSQNLGKILPSLSLPPPLPNQPPIAVAARSSTAPRPRNPVARARPPQPSLFPHALGHRGNLEYKEETEPATVIASQSMPSTRLFTPLEPLGLKHPYITLSCRSDRSLVVDWTRVHSEPSSTRTPHRFTQSRTACYQDIDDAHDMDSSRPHHP
jgi:hypothetical protein